MSQSLAIQIDSQLVSEVAQKLSSDEFQGREMGTEGGRLAREWLLKKMQDLQMVPAGDKGTFIQEFPNGGKSLIGIIYPQNKKTEQKPAVIINAHYDHWGTTCAPNPRAHSKFCNGAADNAGAVAAVLGGAKAMSEKIQAPVIIGLWDGEEKGLLGSSYFSEHPTVDLSKLKLTITLDIIGLNLFKGFESDHFILGSESGGPNLKVIAEQATKSTRLSTHFLSYGFGHHRSDMTSFILGGYEVPFIFFSDGDGTVYHTQADEFENLNVEKVVSVSEAVAQVAILASQSSVHFDYKAPNIHLLRGTLLGNLIGPALRKYLRITNGIVLPENEDAGVLSSLYNKLDSSDVKRSLSPKSQEQIKENAETLKKLSSNRELTFWNRFKLLLFAQKFLGFSKEYEKQKN